MKEIKFKVKLRIQEAGNFRLKPYDGKSTDFVPLSRTKNIAMSKVFQNFEDEAVLEITVKQVLKGKKQPESYNQ